MNSMKTWALGAGEPAIRLNQNADACEDSDKKMELLKMLRELRKVWVDARTLGPYHEGVHWDQMFIIFWELPQMQPARRISL